MDVGVCVYVCVVVYVNGVAFSTNWSVSRGLSIKPCCVSLCEEASLSNERRHEGEMEANEQREQGRNLTLLRC